MKNSDCIYNLLLFLRARLTAWEGERMWLLRIPPSQRSLYGPSGSECCRAQHGVPNAIVTSSLLPWSLSNTTSTSLIICLLSTHSVTHSLTLRETAFLPNPSGLDEGRLGESGGSYCVTQVQLLVLSTGGWKEVYWLFSKLLSLNSGKYCQSTWLFFF